MHQLTQQLQTEHTELQQALAGIKPRQFRTDEGRERLNRVRDLFHNHTETERKKLYPIIEKAAGRDKNLAARLRQLNGAMEIVANLADSFFAKYQEGEPRLIEFATDHGALVTILKIRLKREEETLFPLFDKLTSN